MFRIWNCLSCRKKYYSLAPGYCFGHCLTILSIRPINRVCLMEGSLWWNQPTAIAAPSTGRMVCILFAFVVLSRGKTVEENIINASISRVLGAKTDWQRILECAHNPEMKIILSNTTEVGIKLVQDDITANPPSSFPGKLLAFLFWTV